MAAVASQPPHGQQYYQQQSPAAQAPGNARRPSRRSSNGASPNTPSTPQTNNSTLNTPAMNNTAATTTTTTTTMNQGGPVAPPRTSSHRTSSGTGPSSQQPDRVRDEASQSRRRAKEGSPRQQGGSSRAQPAHSRSATAVGQPPVNTNLPREESAVINRIVVSDTQDDIARAQARQADGVHVTAGADLTPITGLSLVGSEGVDDGGRGAGGKSRQDHSKSENAKRSKFGNYILGQTLGEGEFGKVKMGWKRDSPIEVAIKLIRRETLGSNSNRLQKIYREIHILRGLDHPNIVRLHEMVETERHIGIILEYASGGELFDYILNHRYLKDGPARKLFSQLISGVGYLHRKGIVHRDLKLENLLLDRNKNIIITDFGFANTFDPNDELSEEIEYRLGDKDYIRSLGLEGTDAARRGDLMQTSCGSPCYAAPELVVSDSLYTGRKVDVWSCGVILYAMLAGYLPFDDDPANPEGDNINLLYKYIVSTPLTFPEYVTPHARDLLKRILVPDPRKRADLFEVARHSWLADYAHVVGFITSSNTNVAEAQQASVYSSKPPHTLLHGPPSDCLLEDTFEPQPALARSASVREPAKPHTAPSSAHGGLQTKREPITQAAEKPKATRDTKRRTVQVEYVAPSSQTARGEASPPVETMPKARGKEAEVPTTDGYQSATGARPARSSGAVHTSSRKQEPQRSVSDYTAFGNAPPTATRPSTSGALGTSRLPSRGNSYGQPSVATVAQTNAEGRFSQPKGKQYSISAPYPQQDHSEAAEPPNIGQPSAQRVQSIQLGPQGAKGGHRRSNTVTETLGRMTSMFSGRQPSYSQDPKESLTSQGSYGYPEEKKQKSYPPTSMAGPMSNDNVSATTAPRQSTESSRRTSFGFSRKNTANSGENPKSSRRFSLIPSSLSRTFTSQRESLPAQGSHERRGSNARARASSRPGMGFGRGGESRSPSQSTQGSNMPGFYDGQHDSNSRIRNPQLSASAAGPSSAPPNQTHFNGYNHSAPEFDEKFPNPREAHPSGQGNRPYRQATDDSEASEPRAQARMSQSQQFNQSSPSNPYPPGMGGEELSPQQQQQQRKGVLQKSRRFADAYDEQGSSNKGSSGSSKKVMDFFRRMGKQRTSSR
ncbi:serine/threonine-protein kinase KIN4 [Stemphylium lycopersici]|uniref:non-specific serine/threonine protein kinase n=1 Tax=Stemphylium lycopersici TaxID=183478 RepID=A0A364MUH3_STELY|nr:serine/threonine-protein kinase KIN4 [Stemphylium lycopersici]